jgi:hypothetical protein
MQHLAHGGSDVIEDESRDYEIELDHETGEGYILIRDEAAYAGVLSALQELVEQGWVEVDPDEVELYEFADGGVGVKSWLYKEENEQEVTDGVTAVGR